MKIGLWEAVSGNFSEKKDRPIQVKIYEVEGKKEKGEFIRN